MGLSREEQKLAQLILLAAEGNEEGLREGLSDISWEEAFQRMLVEGFLQVHLFVGYPATIESLRILREECPADVSIPRREPDTGEEFQERGIELCRKIYGDSYESMIEAMREYHPDLPVWILRDGYGRVMAREGLTGRIRELITVLLLARTGYHRQLHSHLRGAIHLGATAEDLKDVWDLLERFRNGNIPDRIHEAFKKFTNGE